MKLNEKFEFDYCFWKLLSQKDNAGRLLYIRNAGRLL
jgi:hypothetical protein